MNNFSEMYNAQTQAYIDVKVPLSPSVLLRNPPPSRREAFFICDVGADSYATTHPPPSRPLYGSHTSHGQRREDCGPPVSLRLGHARGKTTLSCFLTLSRRFATSQGRLGILCKGDFLWQEYFNGVIKYFLGI